MFGKICFSGHIHPNRKFTARKAFSVAHPGLCRHRDRAFFDDAWALSESIRLFFKAEGIGCDGNFYLIWGSGPRNHQQMLQVCVAAQRKFRPCQTVFVHRKVGDDGGLHLAATEDKYIISDYRLPSNYAAMLIGHCNVVRVAKLEVKSESALKVRVTKECDRSPVWTRNTGGLYMAKKTTKKAPKTADAAPQALQESLHNRMMQGFSSLPAPNSRVPVHVDHDLEYDDSSFVSSAEVIPEDDFWDVDAADDSRRLKLK